MTGQPTATGLINQDAAHLVYLQRLLKKKSTGQRGAQQTSVLTNVLTLWFLTKKDVRSGCRMCCADHHIRDGTLKPM